MGVFDIAKPKKTLSELEEEREYNEAEISVLQQKALKKELNDRGVDLESFRDTNGRPAWKRVINWLKTH